MRGNKGITLIEACFVFLIIIAIGTFLAPNINNYVNDAKATVAKSETETIGVLVSRLIADLGPSCLKKDSTLQCVGRNRADILFGEGADVNSQEVFTEDFVYHEIDWRTADRYCSHFSTRNIYDKSYLSCLRQHRHDGVCGSRSINWYDDDLVNGDSLYNQLNVNNPKNRVPNQLGPSAVGTPSGWRGAYLSSPIKTDPWGKRYLINALFFSVPVDVDVYGLCDDSYLADFDELNFPTIKPQFSKWSYDTFVISAGPNGIYETPFAKNGVVAEGDDIIYVIQGDPR